MVAKKTEIPLVAGVKATHVPLADPREIALHLGPVIARYAFRDAGIRHQVLNPGGSEDIRRVLLQSLVVSDDIIGNITGSAEFGVG